MERPEVVEIQSQFNPNLSGLIGRITDVNDDVYTVKYSIFVDGLGVQFRHYRATGDELLILTTVKVNPPVIQDEPITLTVAPVMNGVHKPDMQKAAKNQGYTGDICVNCQSMTLKRNGNCLLCVTCGQTTGCS
jgi:hypothetical protein